MIHIGKPLTRPGESPEYSVARSLRNIEQLLLRLETTLLTIYADKLGDLDSTMLEGDFPLEKHPGEDDDDDDTDGRSD